MKQHIPTILSIAGSDSIGGAGIQADIKTATALGVYAMTAITAVTAQNTMTVNAVAAVDASMLKKQLETIAADIIPDAVKIGMIPNAEAAVVIADFLEKYHLKNIVVDPIMKSTSGNDLSDDMVKDVLCQRIFPIATLVTPNFPEALSLLNANLNDFSQCDIARKLSVTYGINAVLLKGGHLPVKLSDNKLCVDYLCLSKSKTTELFQHPYIESSNTHGTGCTLSSAIASCMAKGLDLKQAVKFSIDWLLKALESAVNINFGKGNGSLNHLFGITTFDYGNNT